MVSVCRVQGSSCSVFFFIGQEFCKNEDDFADMREIGYDVTWENRGAHGTYFDDYNTAGHFQQVENFRVTIAPYMADGENDADELVMVLEDHNPALFNALGAAVEALGRARSEEHVAQVALSGRRYMEQLADVLFPAQEKEHNGQMTWPRFGAMAGAFTSTRMGGRTENDRWLDSLVSLMELRH
jgi:hypothetical protein